MSRDFDAIYRQGHLVPLEPLKLREQERVRVHIEQMEKGESNRPKRDFSNMSFRDALVVTGLLGSLQDAPPDLNTNPKYMEGFGKDDRDSD